MPDGTHGMRGTGTTVAETSLPSQRHTGQIIITGDGRFGIQYAHDHLPLPAMRPDIAQSVQHIGQVMRHFMRYRVGEIVRKVLPEDIRVIAYLPPGLVYTVHTRRPALQIKRHRWQLEFLPKQFSSTLDAATGCGHNLFLLKVSDRCYSHATFPVGDKISCETKSMENSCHTAGCNYTTCPHHGYPDRHPSTA